MILLPELLEDAWAREAAAQDEALRAFSRVRFRADIEPTSPNDRV
jgi:hypothetical protein